MLTKLTEEEMELIRKRYGDDLTAPSDTSLTPKENKKLSSDDDDPEDSIPDDEGNSENYDSDN